MAGSAAALTKEYPLSVESLLGGRSLPRAKRRSALDWIDVLRKGMPAAAIASLARALHLSQTDLATTLGIPERTLARRKREGVLNSDESAKLLRLARVVERANHVFEDFEAALAWLKSPNAALRGAAPLSLLDTDIGAENVLDTLGRIEHGVFA